MKIAVVSGKGGSGKTGVTASFVSLSEKVIAIDCDVDASNLPLVFSHKIEKEQSFVSGNHVDVDTDRCIGCGSCADKCTFGAIKIRNGKAEVNALLCEGCSLCEYICPAGALKLEEDANSVIFKSSFAHGIMIHGNLKPGDDNSGLMISKLREMADEEMAESGIQTQILDGPPGIGCPVLSTMTGMDKVVIVSEPTLSGLSDLKRIYQVAVSFCKDISVIINKCNVNLQNRDKIKNFCEAMHLPVIAEIPFDRIMVDAQLNCSSIVEYAPESECARAVTMAYNKIMGR